MQGSENSRFGIRVLALGGACVASLLTIAWGGRGLLRHIEVTRAYASPPDGMVSVPVGMFWMGSNDVDAAPDERPMRRVFLSAFYIDRYEVTNRQYRAVVTPHAYPAGHDDLPVTGVTRAQAEAYCRAVGKRLPTNAEWEKAARGTDGRRYPWGDNFELGRGNIAESGRAAGIPLAEERACALLFGGKQPVGSFAQGVSPSGCLDMAGNVWEWVAYDYVPHDLWNRLFARSQRGILRGGAYGYGATQARTSYQGFEAPDASCNDTGFRCALDARPRGG